MKKHKKNSGFTLLEMIIVLFALSLSLILASHMQKTLLFAMNQK